MTAAGTINGGTPVSFRSNILPNRCAHGCSGIRALRRVFADFLGPAVSSRRSPSFLGAVKLTNMSSCMSRDEQEREPIEQYSQQQRYNAEIFHPITGAPERKNQKEAAKCTVGD